MSHDHHSHEELKGKNLLISILLNILITVAQVFGGIFSGSLALLTDALHNFSDVLALVISWFAHKLSLKKFTADKTFGYKRAQIIAAMFNSTSLVIIAVYLIKESIHRFYNPQQITSFWVIILAALSILFNGISVLLVKKDALHNINMKSAYLHLLTDMMTSIAVLGGGLIMQYTSITWIDPFLSIIIAFYLIFTSFGLLFKTLKILMHYTPSGIDPFEISKLFQNFNHVKNIHHIHIWQLDDVNIHFEGHVELEKNISLSKIQIILEKIKKELHDKYKITHCILQPEFDGCVDTHAIVENETH